MEQLKVNYHSRRKKERIEEESDISRLHLRLDEEAQWSLKKDVRANSKR